MSDPDPTPSRPLPWRDRIELLTQVPPLTPTRVAAGCVTVALALAVGWFVLRTPTEPPAEELLPLASESAVAGPASTAVATTVLVHVAGAVVAPGVYELRGDARVKDVIDAAGGPAADADVDQLNLAAPVRDGERVYVPRIGETAPLATATGSSTGPLDINTATLDQLDALPGIGPATAQAIIDEHDRRGGFRSVDELLEVRGIGPAKLEQLRDLVRV